MAMVALIRPRAGTFCYSDIEFKIMESDIEAFAKAGANGVAIGALTEKNEVRLTLLHPLPLVLPLFLPPTNFSHPKG